jgi:hypothetical protein
LFVSRFFFAVTKLNRWIFVISSQNDFNRCVDTFLVLIISKVVRCSYSSKQTSVFGLEVFTTVKMMMIWVLAPCRLVEVGRRFRGVCCLRRFDDEGSRCLWNVGKLLTDRTAQHPRRQPSSYLPPWEPEDKSFSVCCLSTCGSICQGSEDWDIMDRWCSCSLCQLEKPGDVAARAWGQEWEAQTDRQRERERGRPVQQQVWSLRSGAGLAARFRPRPSPFVSFAVRYSLAILPCFAVGRYCQLLTAFLNKP